MKEEISIIIPNWNGEKIISRCLELVFNQSFNNFEVILVDNGSTDNSVELVKNKYPTVKIIKLSKNYGFAKAVNTAIKESVGNYIALLNNDVLVTPNWLGTLYTAITSHPLKDKILGVAPKVIDATDNRIIDSAGDKINVVGQAHPRGKGKLVSEYNDPGYVFGVSGAASLFSKSILNHLGLFDEDFFFYFEDVDLSFRAQIFGFKCWYEPRAIVYHYGGKTAVYLGDFVEYQRFRNTMFLVIKNLPLVMFFKRGRFWKIPLVWLHTLYFFVKAGRGKFGIKAVFDVIFFLPRLLNKRRIIMRNRKVSLNYLESLMEEKKLKIFKWSI